MIGIALLAFIVVVGISRYVSLGSLLVVWCFPVYTLMMYTKEDTFVLLLVISLVFTTLAYIKHAGNIKRLAQGTERKLF